MTKVKKADLKFPISTTFEYNFTPEIFEKLFGVIPSDRIYLKERIVSGKTVIQAQVIHINSFNKIFTFFGNRTLSQTKIENGKIYGRASVKGYTFRGHTDIYSFTLPDGRVIKMDCICIDLEEYVDKLTPGRIILNVGDYYKIH